MKFLFRWAFRLFLVLVVLAVALVLSKDALLRSYLEHELRTRSGLDATMGRLELGLFSPTLRIESLKLYNAAEFGGSVLADVPEFHVQYDPASLALGRLHLRLARVSISEVNIVEARDGRTNLSSLFTAASGSGGFSTPAVPSLLGLRFSGIDTLNLSVGKVRYTNLRRPEKSTDLKLGLRNEIITNVKSLGELTNLLMQSLLRNGITIVTEAPRSSDPPVGMKRRTAPGPGDPPTRHRAGDARSR